MNTLTITLHDTDNCGSSLQAYALQHFLLENSIENEIVDYVPSYIKNNGAPFKTWVRRWVYLKESKQRDRKFHWFISHHLKVTNKRYANYEELIKEPPEADAYITGSDQLWNSSYPCGKDKAFYLGFVKTGKKMAYAVSLGKETVPEEEQSWIVENVKDFSWLSVREKTSQILLQQKGFMQAEYVCDPVLLLPRETYQKLQAPRFCEEKYALVYLVQHSNLLEETVQYLKKNFGYKVILCGSYRNNRCTCDVYLRDIGPEDFLGLIANAEVVVASSFHATVFSHIYHKQFTVILPQNNQARIKQFLELTGLEKQIITHTKDIQKVMEPVDYSSPDSKLRPFISASQEKLMGQFK